MHTVFYAGTTFTTGDDLASALLDVAVRVCTSGRPERVDLPCRNVEGIVGSESQVLATLLVVPGAPLLAVHVDSAGDELLAPETANRLREVPRFTRVIAQDPEAEMLATEASYDFEEWM